MIDLFELLLHGELSTTMFINLDGSEVVGPKASESNARYDYNLPPVWKGAHEWCVGYEKRRFVQVQGPPDCLVIVS